MIYFYREKFVNNNDHRNAFRRFVCSIFQHVLGERPCNVNSGLSTGCSDSDQTAIRNANLSEHVLYRDEISQAR